MTSIGSETIGYVGGGRREPRANHRLAQGKPRLRLAEARQGMVGQAGGYSWPLPLADGQSERAVADCAGYPDPIARLSAAADRTATQRRFAQGSDAEGERAWRPHGVAAEQ